MFVRGICAEKSDVEVGHFGGKSATKVVSCVETGRCEEIENMIRNSFS